MFINILFLLREWLKMKIRKTNETQVIGEYCEDEQLAEIEQYYWYEVFW